MRMTYKQLFNEMNQEESPIGIFMSTLGIQPGFTEASLIEAEDCLEKCHPELNTIVLFCYGYILGQTIINNIPTSSWNFKNVKNQNATLDPDDLRKISINLEGVELNIYPFKRIIRFKLEDPAYNLLSFYYAVKETYKGNLKF